MPANIVPDLRLQLLEPEKYPHLYKCLYGLLMLLPQSSAFAALKNRLNSVSAIGYLHIAPRAYVSQSRNNSVVESVSTFQFHQRQKSTETHTSSLSAPSNAGPSTFDRSSRLKGRDEGGIRWNELLEKFRSVQERARRAQRPGGDFDDGLGEARVGDGLDARAFKDLARLQGPPLPVKDTPPAAAVNKSKTSLGKFGRLGGAVASGRPKR